MSFKHWVMKQEGKVVETPEEPDDNLKGWLVSHNGRRCTRYGVVVKVQERSGRTTVWAAYADTREEALENYRNPIRNVLWVDGRDIKKIKYVGSDNL